MIAEYYGVPLSRAELYRGQPVGPHGLSALQLVDIGRQYGLFAEGVHFGPQVNVRAIATPMILHWRDAHFVVLERYRHDVIDIVDPAAGRIRLSRDEFWRATSGIALSFARTPRRRTRVWRARLMRHARGGGAIAAAVVGIYGTAYLTAPLLPTVARDTPSHLWIVAGLTCALLAMTREVAVSVLAAWFSQGADIPHPMFLLRDLRTGRHRTTLDAVAAAHNGATRAALQLHRDSASPTALWLSGTALLGLATLGPMVVGLLAVSLLLVFLPVLVSAAHARAAIAHRASAHLLSTHLHHDWSLRTARAAAWLAARWLPLYSTYRQTQRLLRLGRGAAYAISIATTFVGMQFAARMLVELGTGRAAVATGAAAFSAYLVLAATWQSMSSRLSGNGGVNDVGAPERLADETLHELGRGAALQSHSGAPGQPPPPDATLIAQLLRDLAVHPLPARDTPHVRHGLWWAITAVSALEGTRYVDFLLAEPLTDGDGDPLTWGDAKNTGSTTTEVGAHAFAASSRSLLFPGTVADNIRYGPWPLEEHRIVDALEASGIALALEIPSETVSRMRMEQVPISVQDFVRVARALAYRPTVLVCDDLFRDVSATTRCEYFKALRAAVPVVVTVTTDPALADGADHHFQYSGAGSGANGERNRQKSDMTPPLVG